MRLGRKSNSGISSSLLKELASGNSFEYRQKLQWYLARIEILEKQASRIESNITRLSQLEQHKQIAAIWGLNKEKSDAEIASFERYLGVNSMIARTKQNMQKHTEMKKMEAIMKESYKLIDQLREEITGQKTTFRIAFSVGGAKKGSIYEMQIPLEEILSSAQLSAQWGAGSSAAAMKLRLNASQSKRQSWLEKYSYTNITGSYRSFANLTDKMTTTTGSKLTFANAGRQFEFYKKSRYLENLDQNTLRKLASSISKDRTSFVEGVDFAYKDSTGSHYESLKSFIGKDPSLASLSTILSTLRQTSEIIKKMNDPVFIQQQLEQQFDQHESQLEQSMQQSIEESIPGQVIQPMLESVFKPEQALSSIDFNDLFA